MDRALKYSKDGLCCFDPAGHTYHIGDKRLIGVTSLISRFKNKFDAPKEAAKYAEKHGLKPEDVLKDWDAKGKAGIAQGNAVHDMMEAYILTGDIPPLGQPGKLHSAALLIHDVFATGTLVGICAEEVVHNGHVASMIDCVAENAQGERFILDWKTNKEVSKDSYGKMMLPPFDNIPDATFYYYSLQVSFYRHLYKRFPIRNCYIVHITDTGYVFIKPDIITIPKAVLKYEWKE